MLMPPPRCYSMRLAVIATGSVLLLHLAVRAARMDPVELLVAHGAQVRAVDSGIFVAVSDLHIMRYLLSRGASVTLQDHQGRPRRAWHARPARLPPWIC